MGNSASRQLNSRAPREIYYDLGFGDIIARPLMAPAEAPKIKARKTMSFARMSTMSFPRKSTMGDRRVIGAYPKNYHW
ncbi:hypothetical protein Daus18300_008545 [Diaporthe australafricana]|uniref:Uncharacterized protein n=1 Tax=Diaporthe australafricana TaxID=127596 RepID=A0ABR3WI09_9PEZI